MSLTLRLKSIPELLSAILGLSVDDCEELHKAAGNTWNIVKRVDLQQKYAINGAEVGRLVAGIELAKRTRLEEDRRNKIGSPTDVADMFEHLNGLAHEEVWVAFISADGYLLDTEQFAKGDTGQVPVPIHLIARQAIMKNASAIVMVHNHPATGPSPSLEDTSMINSVGDLFKALHIRYWDDIIIADGSYYSFHEHNQMPFQKDRPKGPAGAPQDVADLLSALGIEGQHG